MKIYSIRQQYYPNFFGSVKLQQRQNNATVSRNQYVTTDTFCRTNNTQSCSTKKYIETKGEFRDLATNKIIHCPYCGLPMISMRNFYDLKNRGVFSSPIGEFVKEVKPYEKCLKPGNRAVFNLIESYAERAPQTHLSRVISLMYKDSLKKLRESQKPIFMEFVRAAYELPEEYKPEFRKFMELQRAKLLEIPHIEPFNRDDFQYKLKKMAETLDNCSQKTTLISLADCMNTTAFDDENLLIPDLILKKIFSTSINDSKCLKVISSLTDKRKKLQLDNNSIPIYILSSPNNKGYRQAFINNMNIAINTPGFTPESIGITREEAEKIAKLAPTDRLAAQNLVKQDIQLYIINQVRLIGEKLGRDDIIYLSKISKNMLQNKPVVIQFSNKAFQLDLVKQLKGLEKTPIYYRLTDIAKKLPDSASNKNSFIAKHKYSNSETIGFYLLRPSVATIEHIKPTHDKGKNNMSNWALACEHDNNKRMHTKLEEFLVKFDPENIKIYFDEIQEASIEGLIDPLDVISEAKAFEDEGNVTVDLSKIKNYYNL